MLNHTEEQQDFCISVSDELFYLTFEDPIC